MLSWSAELRSRLASALAGCLSVYFLGLFFHFVFLKPVCVGFLFLVWRLFINFCRLFFFVFLYIFYFPISRELIGLSFSRPAPVRTQDIKKKNLKYIRKTLTLMLDSNRLHRRSSSLKQFQINKARFLFTDYTWLLPRCRGLVGSDGEDSFCLSLWLNHTSLTFKKKEEKKRDLGDVSWVGV